MHYDCNFGDLEKIYKVALEISAYRFSSVRSECSTLYKQTNMLRNDLIVTLGLNWVKFVSSPSGRRATITLHRPSPPGDASLAEQIGALEEENDSIQAMHDKLLNSMLSPL